LVVRIPSQPLQNGRAGGGFVTAPAKPPLPRRERQACLAPQLIMNQLSPTDPDVISVVVAVEDPDVDTMRKVIDGIRNL
jgi:hypothetical protein